jgi:broad specificity phosphatase PhoE
MGFISGKDGLSIGKGVIDSGVPSHTARNVSITDSKIDQENARRARRPSLLVLVRHAESQRNVAKKGNRFFLDDEARKRIAGVSDHRTRLTTRGRLQAAQTGTALRAAFGAFEYAYHSGYSRTRETLDGMLAAYSEDERAIVKVRHHLFLRERDTGHTFDMTTAEAEAAFPWLQE